MSGDVSYIFVVYSFYGHLYNGYPIFSGVKWPERGADHLPPSSAMLRIGKAFVSTSSVCVCVCVWCRLGIVGVVTNLQAGPPRIYEPIPGWCKTFLSTPKVSVLSPRPTPFPLQWIPRPLSSGVKWPRHGSDHSSHPVLRMRISRVILPPPYTLVSLQHHSVVLAVC